MPPLRHLAYLIAGLSASCTVVNRPDDRTPCERYGALCDPAADCIDQGQEYRCQCPRGYDDINGDGTLCRDIDECAAARAPCRAPTLCKNEPGGFSCYCPPGSVVAADDERRCVEIDACSTGMHDCDAETEDCEALAGGEHRCVCKPGFAADGDRGCRDIDECSLEPAPECAAPFTCENVPGSYECRCPEGTQFTAARCQAVDPCADDREVCGAGAQCVSLSATRYRCDCLPGYVRGSDSSRCEDIDECADPEVCQAGATCTNRLGSFDCTCRAYYKTSEDGSRCIDTRLDWSLALSARPLFQPLADSVGNLFLAGTFAEAQELCGKALAPNGATDVFIAKLDREHRCVWLQLLGGESAEVLRAAAIDPEGNPVLSVSFSGSITVAGSAVTGSNRARLVAKLAGSDGSSIWAKSFNNIDPQSGAAPLPRDALASDHLGNILWASRLSAAAELTDADLDENDPDWDAILVKLDARMGTVLWWNRFGVDPPQPAFGTSVAIDRDGEVWTAGLFLNWVFLDENTPLTGYSNRWNGYVAKLSPEGTLRYGKQVDGDFVFGADHDGALELAATPAGGMLLAGTFRGALRYHKDVPTSRGAQDIMLAELDPQSGEPRWVRTFGGSGTEQLGQLAVDPQGRIALAGSFDATLDMGDGPLRAAGEWSDVFVASSAADGELRWSQRFGGDGPEHGARLAVGPTGDLAVAAGYTPPLAIEALDVTGPDIDPAIVLQLEP